jgi:succinate dehydrogenase / fumarate reductase cytochrome b subunit
MVNKRPININPLSIRLPIMALVSITHRISGILVLLLIPYLLWTLQLTLVSPEGLNQVRDAIASPGCKIFLWVLLSALIFHLLAGFRHLLMDCHIGDSLRAGRIGAYVVFIGTFLLMILVAFWLWR